MQKNNNKLQKDTNHVGAYCIRPHFEGNTGITLIALVVTIIVLIILAAVSLNLLLGENGIIGRAQQASKETKLAAFKEKLEMEIAEIVTDLLANGKEANLDNVGEKLDELGYDVNLEDDGTLTVETEDGGKATVYPDLTVEVEGAPTKNEEGSTTTPENTPTPTLTPPVEWDDTKVEEEVNEGSLRAPVPKGYAPSKVAGEDTITGGLVIYEGTTEVNTSNHSSALTNRNQYVWIPIANVNDMFMCKAHGASETLTFNGSTFTCSAGEENPSLAGKLYATTYGESFNSNLTGQTHIKDSGFREPDLLTQFDIDTNTSYLTAAGVVNFSELQTQMETDLKDLAVSVATYGGFYIGRYETSLNGGVAESKKGKTVMNSMATSGNMWYGMYAKQRRETSTVKINMIFGCSWDQVMKFVNGKQDGAGNNYDVKTILPAKHTGTPEVSGNNTFDKVANIYDLEGNFREWTAEAVENSARLLRRRLVHRSYYQQFLFCEHPV